MIQHGAKLEWTPADVQKKKEADAAGGAGGRGNGNVGKTAAMMAMVGGRGAAFAAEEVTCEAETGRSAH